MRILLIIASDSGTIARVSNNLYKALIKAGHEVKTLCFSPSNVNSFDFGEMFVPECPHAPGINFITDKIFRIRFISKVKREYKPDLTIATQTGCDALNALSKRIGKNIAIVHAILWQAKIGLPKEYPIFVFTYKHLLKRYDKVIGISREVVEDLKINANHVKAELAYNIHDVDNIIKLGKEPLTDSEELDIFKKKVLLYVGHLFTNVKCPQRLVEAYALMSAEDRSQTNLVFIGQSHGDTADMLKARCAELGLNNVFFFGEKSNPYQYISRCEMLVSPSRNEGLPGVHIESLILGKKVVSTSSSTGVWDIMECFNNYKKDLRENFICKNGVITVNNPDDENSTIEFLSEGITYALHHDFPEISNFDSDRFKDVNVIKHYLSV